MNSRERITAAFEHTKPDRTPLFEYILLPPLVSRILGRNCSDYRGRKKEWLEETDSKTFEKKLKQYARDRIETACILGHDMISVAPNPVPGKKDHYDALYNIGSNFSIQPHDDPAKRIRLRNRDVSQMLQLKPEDDSFLIFHLILAEMKQFGIDIPVFAPAYYHGLWTDIDLMQTMLLDPPAAEEHFSLATQRTFNLIDAYNSLDIEMIGIGGDVAGNRPLVSKECYRHFIMPEVRKCARKIRKSGRYSINTSDGNLWEILDDFLIESEVDGYLEIDQQAGMDIKSLKKMYGSAVLLFGNIDPGQTLSFLSPGEIQKVTREILRSGKGNGGHIFTASNAITSSVPLKNYEAMVNAYRGEFGISPLHIS